MEEPVCGEGTRVYVCSEHVCKGAQARSRNAVIKPSCVGLCTQAPPASGHQTPLPVGSMSLSGLKRRRLARGSRREAAVC